jgi:predicted solute-binding protein
MILSSLATVNSVGIDVSGVVASVAVVKERNTAIFAAHTPTTQSSIHLIFWCLMWREP